MAKIFILIALYLLCTKAIILVQGQISDCSEYFTYITELGATDMSKLLGQIEIPTPPENDEFHLKVALHVDDSSKNFVRLKLARSTKESVRAVQEGNSLLYHMHFPLASESNPTLSAIWFNNRQYCSNSKSKGNIKANLVLGHIVFLPNEEPLSWRRNSTTYRINNPSYDYLNSLNHSKANSTTPFVSNNECGITSYYTDDINNLISNGEKALPGQWPWMVAIFVVRTSYEFLCGGSILTTRHIITAGHCMKEFLNDTVDPDDLFVAFGKLNSRHWRDKGTIIREVGDYEIHPDYAHAATADSDLAILMLRTPVDFSPFIKPICLWFGPFNLQNVIGRTGYVVGWGESPTQTEVGFSGFNPYIDEPRMARMPIVSQEDCHSRNPYFVRLTSNRTFCAGLQNENNLCNVDSGSGLVLFDSITGRYQLRGIVSRPLFDGGNRRCIGYMVYVDVAKYVPWIRQQISTT
ncbi:serine protease gd isoform X2 [Monomorium pharaonis]|nr:serine protease gd isoform X2 [Monomorium pharaonis]XP_012521488.1 serine protease gd isoform X2 [Monomorium pharaonis]